MPLMFRNLLLVCLALLSGVISIYAFRTAEPAADLRYVNPSGIHTLDPVRMSWTQDFRIALNVWEGLTTWDPQTLEPLGAAADDPPQRSPDRRTYTFTLREDERWSNGDPVTARDFVRGWRRGLEPGSAADYAFLLRDHIEGAADYVRQRRRAVTALTVLSRLRDGWSVADDLLRAFAALSLYDELRSTYGDALPEPPNHGRGQAQKRFAHELQGADIDWDGVYRRVFDAHRREFDHLFEQVAIDAVDDRTLRVTLTQPCPYFLDLTALPVFLPAHESIERLRERAEGAPFTREGLVVYDPQWTKPDYHRNGYPGLITNGPYRIRDWVFKRRVRLVVNPHHRAAAGITTRTVDMLVYENGSAALMAYEAGDVDFLPGMNVPYDHEIARLAMRGERPDFHLCPVLATYFLSFNCVSETVNQVPNPFRDARVRRAFALAIDKEAIVTRVLARGDRIAHSFIPEGAIAGYHPPEGVGQDVEQARRWLSIAGYPAGEGLPPIELLYTFNDRRVCQALARMWETTLGVRVRLIGKESKTFAEDKADHRFMIARGNWYADYNDPTTFLDCLTTHNGNNDSGYSNSNYDELMARASWQSDPAERMAMLRRAETIIVEEDFPIVPILHYAEPLAIKPYVHGLYPNARLWFPFQYVRVAR